MTLSNSIYGSSSQVPRPDGDLSDRRSMTRRRMVISAGVLVSSALLAGCGATTESRSDGGSRPPAAAPAATQVTRPALVPATIKYLHFDTGQQIWNENWGKIFSTFEAKHSGVKIQTDLVTSFQMLTDKATATFVAGDYYDMLYGHFSVLAPFTQADMIQPLDAFLARDGEVSASDFLPAAMEKFKGRIYGLAWFTNGKEIWYNADLFRAAGMETPAQLEAKGTWTWDTLFDTAKKLTKMEGNEVDVYGFNMPFNALSFFIHNIRAWGGEQYDTGFTRPLFDQAPVVNAVEFAADMITKHRVAGGGDFTKGKLAMHMTGSFYARTVEDRILKENPFKVEMAPLPKGPASAGGRRVVALANNCNYIGKTSKAPDQTWAFNKHLLGAETQPFVAQLGGGRYVANTKVRPVTLFPYEDLKVYQSLAPAAQPTPLIAKQADLDREWRELWAALQKGDIGVRAGLTQVNEKATQYLREAGCIC
jgi:multiple sugar transport system substrate-binding protein